jgi:hypothetical protein
MRRERTIRELVITMKRLAARPKELEDIRALEAIKQRSPI